MTITLSSEQIRQDMRLKSHLETQSLQGEAKREARADEQKIDEIDRCIVEAFSSLVELCNRWLEDGCEQVVNDTLTVPENFILNLDITERRKMAKEKAIVGAMHGYMVKKALSLYYISVAQGDMAAAHQKQALEAAQSVTNLLFIKRQPQVV